MTSSAICPASRPTREGSRTTLPWNRRGGIGPGGGTGSPPPSGPLPAHGVQALELLTHEVETEVPREPVRPVAPPVVLEPLFGREAGHADVDAGFAVDVVRLGIAELLHVENGGVQADDVDVVTCVVSFEPRLANSHHRRYRIIAVSFEFGDAARIQVAPAAEIWFFTGEQEAAARNSQR
jgi:hypothetical protein